METLMEGLTEGLMEGLFPPLAEGVRRSLENLPGIIDRTFPLPRRLRAGPAGGRGLAADVGELSRLLTRERGDRELGYLGKPGLLSAYLRYFLPWNVYRLCRLLPALTLPLRDGAALIDLGSGPLTFPLALWISRPDLRGLNLEFRCLDRTGAALDAGKRLFTALAGADSPWLVKPIRAALGAPVRGPRAALVSAVNLYTEVLAPREPLGPGAEKQARLLSALAGEEGAVLVVEPGQPRSGEALVALRSAFGALGRPPRAPCPHCGPCPFPGGFLSRGRGQGKAPGKARWCHFGFETADAPRSLHRLSAEAGFPKERAVLSFLLAGPLKGPGSDPAISEPAEGPREQSLLVRVISDPFPLPRGAPGQGEETGRYGCSERGLVLVTGTPEAAGSAGLSDRQGLLGPGSLLRLRPPDREQRDAKSGALVIPGAG